MKTLVVHTHSSKRDSAGALSKFAAALKTYLNIIYALIMHDIKNRFFGSGLGQIVMIIWPFAHIVILIMIYTFTNRPHPYGEGIVQYSAVSVYPFIIFNYVSRWIVLSAINNKSFLQYPIITPLDILVARGALEIVSIFIVGILVLLLVSVAGFDVMPSNPLDAVAACLGSIFLALGIGFLNAPIAFIIPMWNIVITLIIILAWVASGVIFVVSELPEAVRTPLSYNPLLQCTEWMRVAYFSSYPTSVLDRTYVIECGAVMLTSGLLLNKVLKRFY